MEKEEFIKITKSLEYLACTEVLKEIRSVRNYNIKLNKNFCSEKDIEHLTDMTKKIKKYYKEYYKEWFLKNLKNNEIIDLAKNYKNEYNAFYNFIYSYYNNVYRSEIGLIEFTDDEINWYKSEAKKYQNIFINKY